MTDNTRNKIMGALTVGMGILFVVYLILLIIWNEDKPTPAPTMPAGVCVLTSTDFNEPTIATVTPGRINNGVIVCDAGNWVSTQPVVSK